MKRRRSLLGSKGPSTPGAAGKPGPGDDPVEGEGEGASGSDDAGSAARGDSGFDYRAAYDNALAPPPADLLGRPPASDLLGPPPAADPLDDASFGALPVAKPAWMVSDEDLDSMRAPTPPPISRRNDVIASPAASSGWADEGSSLPAGDSGAEAADYSRAGMGGPLSPMSGDGFGGFDDLEPPPTEEVPTGVYEDVSTPYRAPMNVPEPPPIPGIVDRFTPPPVQRSEIGAHQAANRPSYLADATPAPAQARSGAKPFKSYDDELEERKAAEDDEGPQKGPPTMLLVGLAGIALVLVALAGVAWMMQPGPPPPTAANELPADAGIAGVKVRNNMRVEPGLIGAEGAPSDPAAATAPAPEVPAPAPAPVAAPEPAPAPAPAPAPVAPPVEAPKPAPAPKPAAAPKPAPAPKPVAPAPAPVADKGTLKIRANRRVLVYVNGQAIGYTPQDYKVNPGTYSVSAMVPGQPDTKQTLDTKLDAAGATAPVDFSF